MLNLRSLNKCNFRQLDQLKDIDNSFFVWVNCKNKNYLDSFLFIFHFSIIFFPFQMKNIFVSYLIYIFKINLNRIWIRKLFLNLKKLKKAFYLVYGKYISFKLFSSQQSLCFMFVNIVVVFFCKILIKSEDIL